MASFFGGPLKLSLGATCISPTFPHFVFCIVRVKLEIWRLLEGNIRCLDGLDRLCHVLSDPGGLAAVHEATSNIRPSRSLGSHCWERSDVARSSYRKTRPLAWGAHFSSSPCAVSCLSCAAAVLFPINLPC